MSDLDFQIATTYSSNLKEMLDKNEAALSAHIAKIKGMDVKLKIEYDFDASAVKKQIDELHAKIQAIANAQGRQAATPGAGMLGGVMNATQQQATDLQGLLERTTRMVKTKKGEITTQTDKVYDPATKDITSTTINPKTGKTISQFTSQKDRENALKAAINDPKYAGLNQSINRAQGEGNAPQQIALLEKRKAILQDIAKEYADIAVSPAYRQLVSSAERTQRKIDTLQGGAASALEKQKAREAEKTNQALEKQKARDTEKTKRFTSDQGIQADRQRKALDEVDYVKSRDALKASRAGVTNAADLATINQQIANLDAARVQSLERSAALYRDMANEAKRLGDYQLAGRANTLADNYTREARRTEKAVGGEKNKRYVEATKKSFENDLLTAKQRLATEQQILDAKLKQARAAKDIAEQQRVLRDKARSFQSFSSEAADFGKRAGLRGFGSVEKGANTASFAAGLDGKKAADSAALLASSVGNLGNATKTAGEKAKSSGGNFSSIAYTFLRWNVAARLVTGSMQAMFALLEGATQVDRQFAVLQNIFRGTSEEAQQLKKDTIDLAIANGKSTEEALSAATGFARLGLSRVAINKLVETSLIAANVAEIDSGAAAEKLTALMQQYKLSVDEVAQALNRLNSISNTNNVTVGQLLNNIALTASVARQAGIALEDLEGIIGTTIAATKATSSEIGNAVKFVLQRIRKPENIEALKLEFDLDLTKANGDLREGTEILAELARIYPLLTKAQQTRLLDLSAGTRQASRFAAVLENFNKAQLTTANAIGDTNSALRENKAITATLASQIQSLESAWTSLGVAIGDTGILDQFAEKVADVKDYVQTVADLVNERDRNAAPIAIKGNKDRSALDVLSDAKGGGNLFFDKTTYTKEELETFRKGLVEIEKAQQKINIAQGNAKISKGEANKQSAAAKSELSQSLKSLGFENVKYGGRELNQIDGLLRRLDNTDQGSSGISALIDGLLGKDAAKNSSSQLTALRGRVEQFTRGEKQANSIASQVQEQAAAGKADPRRIRADFESLQEVMRELPNGGNLFATSLDRVNKALDTGDYATVVQEYRNIAAIFANEKPTAEKSFTDVQTQKVAEINERLTVAVATKNELLSNNATADAITAANVEIKDLNDQLVEAKKTAADIKVEILTGEENAGVTKILDNMKKRVDQMREALESNTGGERTETARLVLARGSATNRVGVNNAQRVLEDTQEGADQVLAGLSKGTAEYDRQKKIQDDLIESAKTRLRLEYEAADAIDQQNRNAFSANRIREGISLGKADFSIAENRYGAGATDTDKLRAQITGDIRIQRAAAERLRALGQDADPALRARPIATILTAQESAQQRLIDLKRRELQIGVEMEQSQINLEKAEKERTNEVSKRLALASREEQLIAAMLQGTINRGGALSQDEFLGLSQRNRQVADQYLTAGGNPFSGEDSPRGQAAKLQQELREELAAAGRAISSTAAAIAANQKIIENGSVVGGPFADRGVGPGNRALQGTNASPTNGSVILNAQGTVFNINLAQTTAELQKVFTTQLDLRVSNVMKQIRQEFQVRIPRDPDTTPAAAVNVQ